jgi:hypothetical protein
LSVEIQVLQMQAQRGTVELEKTAWVPRERMAMCGWEAGMVQGRRG